MVLAPTWPRRVTKFSCQRHSPGKLSYLQEQNYFKFQMILWIWKMMESVQYPQLKVLLNSRNVPNSCIHPLPMAVYQQINQTLPKANTPSPYSWSHRFWEQFVPVLKHPLSWTPWHFCDIPKLSVSPGMDSVTAPSSGWLPHVPSLPGWFRAPLAEDPVKHQALETGHGLAQSSTPGLHSPDFWRIQHLHVRF